MIPIPGTARPISPRWGLKGAARAASWSGLVLAGLLMAYAPFPSGAREAEARTVRIEASQFGYWPAQIKINPGDRVTLELVSTDVVHGLYVDGYGQSVEADPGQPERLTFVADRAGSFRLRCNVTCGALHPFMIGRLQVGENIRLYRSMGLAVLVALGTLAQRVHA
jgi:heme/copper-type cytochrome/quinol oxidase subunit 2